MNTLLIILLVMAMAGVLGVLVAGMVGLVRGGGDPARSNRLMRWRVILQFAALALFALLLSLLGR
ncbi:twin transmembrane helix small protein [Rhodovastum atsumiense]|uniref:Twin transmembrane helix small protein n=1 Tax=Rhodovastum atsumiense TaxID=504468 RepID=A0A5M6J0V7_9PROT|nr:twin transmembrane helix small protein [Rhodovastum atsumiense]KAA5613285.1 twin transmembrane helix small protein [Rhodovastum atsumiense]